MSRHNPNHGHISDMGSVTWLFFLVTMADQGEESFSCMNRADLVQSAPQTCASSAGVVSGQQRRVVSGQRKSCAGLAEQSGVRLAEQSGVGVAE